MSTHRIKRSYFVGGVEYSQSREVTIDGEKNAFPITIPGSGAGGVLAVNIQIDISHLKMIYIQVSDEVTMHTNGVSEDHTFTINELSPLEWDDESPLANPFTEQSATDVATLNFTNGNAAAVTGYIFTLQDVTPS